MPDSNVIAFPRAPQPTDGDPPDALLAKMRVLRDAMKALQADLEALRGRLQNPAG